MLRPDSPIEFAKSCLPLFTLRIFNFDESSAYLGEVCVHSLFEVQEILDGQGIHFKDASMHHAKPKLAPRMIRKTGDYVKSHFMELIAAEMRKTVA